MYTRTQTAKNNSLYDTLVVMRSETQHIRQFGKKIMSDYPEELLEEAVIKIEKFINWVIVFEWVKSFKGV